MRGIQAHCWNKDGSQIAVIPNNSCQNWQNMIFIFDSNWQLLTTLDTNMMNIEDSLVDLDWNHEKNEIVACSWREITLWKFDDDNHYPKWKKVSMEACATGYCKSGAPSVRWSKNGRHFVCTSYKTLSVYTFGVMGECFIQDQVMFQQIGRMILKH